jgi:hypothetical protein
MNNQYIPLVSDSQYLVTNETFEAAAYIANKIHLYTSTWHEDQAYFVFQRNDVLNEAEMHYLEGRLRGNLQEHARQYQLLIKRIRRFNQ